jgi:hypothetical protein
MMMMIPEAWQNDLIMPQVRQGVKCWHLLEIRGTKGNLQLPAPLKAF